MRFERDVCLNLAAAQGRHWLETDGLGGYASSTLLAVATSRFHGLLVAPSREQPERHVFVSRCEETFHGAGREFPISDARFPGALHPGGHRFLDRFDLAPAAGEPHPRSTYRIGHVVVTREVRMLRGRPATLVRYTATGQRQPIQLHLRPFLPCRRADSLSWINDGLDERVAIEERGFTVRPYTALPAVAVTVSRAAPFLHAPFWTRGVEYADDLARGYDGHEDQWTPGEFHVPLASGDDVVIAFAIGEAVADPAAAWAASETAAVQDDTVRATLEAACEHYLYRDDAGRPGVIAGYPWFGEWGRDTLIALPGLTLARGDVEACGDVLSGLLPWLRDGRLPNVFGASPEASDYKAVDPAMWFGRAVRLYADAGGDAERLRDDLLPALLWIAESHRVADGPALRCDDDGVLFAGTPDVAVTWMDAVIDGRPVTPREGAQVEVNALWYVLVDTLAGLLQDAGDARATDWEAFRDRLGAAFVRRFWIERRNRLADRLLPDGTPDDTIRPNMVIAAALEPSPLSTAQREAVVDLSRAELLTTVGLRTLSPRYLRYRGRFEGNQQSRDDAYHQGTVWPWLLGFHVEAELRALGHSREIVARLRGFLDGLAPHLAEHGLGHVSEVFDGDPPHRPGGCFAQAWSVAEMVRAYALLDAGAGGEGGSSR